MTDKINFNYLESYAQQVSQLVCDDYFGSRKYMTGQEIIRLTPSQQVNLLTIKSLFVAWQEELEKLKSNPYFDYRDIAVDNALKEFMNVLSRAIKVERIHFEPLLQEAIEDTILLAFDPVTFFNHFIDEGKENYANYKDTKKYIKCHHELLNPIVDRASRGDASAADLKLVLRSKFELQKKNLETPEKLLQPLNQLKEIEMDRLLEQQQEQSEKKEPQPSTRIEEPVKEPADSPKPVQQEETKEPSAPTASHRAAPADKAIDPALAWAKFESEEYSYMKGSVDNLPESVGINQRFMFTRELFQGNPDLLKHALKSIDKCDSFVEAIELINERYVAELNWDKNSDAVDEFLQLVFRKFENR